jgi:hypothetical protein
MIGLFLYLSVNTMHSLSMQQKLTVGKLLRKTNNLVFNRLKMYVGLIMSTIVAFFVLAGIYYMFDWLVLLMLGGAIQTPAVYSGYAVVNTVVVFVLAFGLVAFNRAYFYNIVQRAGGTKSL